MTYPLWDQAQGKLARDCTDGLYREWPARCKLCGRRIELDEFVSVFIGEADTAIVIHEICNQHGGKHADCLKGVEVDFGDGKSWPAIWAGNLSNELSFWLRAAARFVWLALTHSLWIVMHPVRYRRYKQWIHELGVE